MTQSASLMMNINDLDQRLGRFNYNKLALTKVRPAERRGPRQSLARRERPPAVRNDERLAPPAPHAHDCAVAASCKDVVLLRDAVRQRQRQRGGRRRPYGCWRGYARREGRKVVTQARWSCL